ncbi:MAG TPA: VanZ family protein [Permianibacter sp.]|nr:VanZ family protein [Permianibacter sp.]
MPADPDQSPSPACRRADAAPARPGLGRLLAGLALLISYVSLYPFRFRPEIAMVEPPFSAMDMVANILLFLPFGLLARWLAAEGHDDRPAARNRLALWLLAGAALAAALQWLQLFVPGRLASLMDVGMNWIGLGLGAAIAPWWSPSRWQGASRLWLGSRFGLLLLCWLAMQLSPFLPSDFERAWARQSYLFTGLRWQTLLWLGQVLGWLLLLALAEQRLRRRHWLLLMLTALALQPWLQGNVLRAEELLAPPVALLLYRLGLHRSAWLLALLVALLLVRGLMPWPGQASGYFHWLPFGAVVTAPFPHALATLAEKAFWYGCLFELGCRLGWSPRRWLGLAVMGLLLLELAQLNLPRHRAELTDPLLLVVMAALLRRLPERLPPPVSVPVQDPIQSP